MTEITARPEVGERYIKFFFINDSFFSAVFSSGRYRDYAGRRIWSDSLSPEVFSRTFMDLEREREDLIVSIKKNEVLLVMNDGSIKDVSESFIFPTSKEEVYDVHFDTDKFPELEIFNELILEYKSTNHAEVSTSFAPASLNP